MPVPPSVRREAGDNYTVAKFFQEVLPAPETPHTTRFEAQGLAPSTQGAHRQNIRWLCRNLTEVFRVAPHMQLDTAILMSIEHAEQERHWVATSTMTRLASIQGALRLLPLYRLNVPSIEMKGCIRWLQGLRGVAIRAVAHRPHQPRPATAVEAQQAWQQASLPVAVVIELAWLAAGRISDILQLKVGDVILQPTAMVIAMRAGKTARKAGFSISTSLPSAQLTSWIQQHRQPGWLFGGVSGEMVREALRAVNPALEQRSLRRGRLQQLAQAGMSDAQLLQLSRHATIQMLRRYLDMGVVSADNKRNAALITAAESH